MDINQLDSWISEFPKFLNDMPYLPLYSNNISYDDISYRTELFFNIFNARFDVKTIELEDDENTILKYFNYRDKEVTKTITESNFLGSVEYEYQSEPYEDCFYPEIEHQNLIETIRALKSGNESKSK